MTGYSNGQQQGPESHVTAVIEVGGLLLSLPVIFYSCRIFFVRRVNEQGVPCTVRDTRGQEIAAACGQLAAEG
ncbi:hypothetical protein HLB23_23560 [Nocardia uniformis]|uniref:Uncharacterized protein n=1 Tax=Nocardia uniformis TaxID=53432 RepID=A0A849C264_9NOCA|nr:hypothetical protein [Nocardia uniformis]NNH72802.1 hypothetical protein [Nocardia uniformis]